MPVHKRFIENGATSQLHRNDVTAEDAENAEEEKREINNIDQQRTTDN
ncbi:hypothetical protein [Microcoleus sp.]